MSIIDGLRSWLQVRWDGPEKIETFLNKPLTRNVSWAHTLGSLLLVYLLFQMLTGILLGFYYSPSPDSAYASLRYVREDLFLGRFVFKLHKFGAGFIIVTAFLHAARSYFLAAYKSPRELLWLSGLLLGILLTLFAFTGQLLPYDQHGYWATVVGIRIASSAPSLGEMIRAVLTGGYGDIGATTLARFYVLHVCVLPLAFMALIALHLGMLQRVGSAGPTSGPREPIRPFFPTQVYKDVLVAAAGAAALFLTAGLLTAADTGPANPASGDFVPRPEWFFLAHYEILRVLPGKWQILGTFVLPNVLLGLLVVLPFIDRGKERSPRRRKFATVAGVVVCAALIGLTIKGIASEPRSAGKTNASAAQTPAQRGRALFVEKKCITCHTIEGIAEGGTKGPNLTHVASRIRADYFPQWIRNPRNLKPTTEMPAFEGTEDELSSIVEYLLTLK